MPKDTFCGFGKQIISEGSDHWLYGAEKTSKEIADCITKNWKDGGEPSLMEEYRWGKKILPDRENTVNV